jgi:hypothetical protein
VVIKTFNPFTANLDYVQTDVEVAANDARYIKLDFSNLPDSPIANGFAKNGVDTLELWFNSTRVQSWTVTPTVMAPRRASLWFLMPYISS